MWIDSVLFEQIKKSIPLPCVDLLILFQGKLLLGLRNNEPGKNIWFLPGGRILLNESLESSVSRILFKETGLTTKKINQVGAMSHFWPQLSTVTVYYTVIVTSDNIILNNEHSTYKWVDSVDEQMHPFLKEMIINSNIFDNEVKT